MHNELSAIIIPVAGMGLRMRQSGCSKCLISLGKELLINRLARQLRSRWPGTPVYLCVGYNKENIYNKTKAQFEYVFCPDFESTNVTESLRLALLQAPPGPILVTMGDLVFSEETFHNINLKGNGVLWGETSLNRITEVGLTITEQKVVGSLSHGLPIRWAQLAYLSSEARSQLSNLLKNQLCSNWFLYEALNQLIPISPLEFDSLAGWMVELDTTKDIKLARFAIQMEEESRAVSH